VNIQSTFRFINFFRSVSIYIHFIYLSGYYPLYGKKPVMFCSGYAQIFLLTPFMLYLCPKKNSTNHFELCASSKQYYVPTLCLDMSDLLPVTPTIQTAKPEITISQQLLGRFCSSFQGMKPYPYAYEIVIYNCTNINISGDKVHYIFS
jgi:hypothetical protein